jgi:hypothetical protein
MTGVMLGQSVVLAFLLTVSGHVRPIGGSRCRGEGPHGSLSDQKAPRVPRGEAGVCQEGRALPCPCCRGRALLMTSWGSGEAETAVQGACLTRDLSATLGRDGGWLSVDTLSAPLAGWFYRGPYDEAVADVQGAIFRRSLSTLVF